MKTLKILKSFEISTKHAKEISDSCEHADAAAGCVATAIRDENYFLIETCIEVLC